SFQISGSEAPEIKEANIPPLLLQPFIENAIWHGLLPSYKPEKILLIDIISCDDNIEIIIDDNGVGRKGVGEDRPKKAHKSMGMQIIKERIDLYNISYSGKIDYTIIDKKTDDGLPDGTRIVLRLLDFKKDGPIC